MSGPRRQDDEPSGQPGAPVLAHLAVLTAPTGTERDRIRLRVERGLDAPAPNPPAPRGRRETGAARRSRTVLAAAAILTLLASLGGISVLLARDALPGEALYGVKRATETATLGMTIGAENTARKHLEFATNRVTELEALAERHRYDPTPPADGYLTALTDFGEDATAGSRSMIELATRGGGAQLAPLRTWADELATRLAEVTPRLPAPARGDAEDAAGLADRIATRASTLRARMSCYRITSGDHDGIGALPAAGPCESTPEAGAGAAQPNPEPRQPAQRPLRPADADQPPRDPTATGTPEPAVPTPPQAPVPTPAPVDALPAPVRPVPEPIPIEPVPPDPPRLPLPLPLDLGALAGILADR